MNVTGSRCPTCGRTSSPPINTLFEMLPAPGEQWAHADRKTFLFALEAMFNLVYGSNNLSPSLPNHGTLTAGNVTSHRSDET